MSHCGNANDLSYLSSLTNILFSKSPWAIYTSNHSGFIASKVKNCGRDGVRSQSRVLQLDDRRSCSKKNTPLVRCRESTEVILIIWTKRVSNSSNTHDGHLWFPDTHQIWLKGGDHLPNIFLPS
jgi:hypothetical protein